MKIIHSTRELFFTFTCPLKMSECPDFENFSVTYQPLIKSLFFENLLYSNVIKEINTKVSYILHILQDVGRKVRIRVKIVQQIRLS